jgi:hypothetical protein
MVAASVSTMGLLHPHHEVGARQAGAVAVGLLMLAGACGREPDQTGTGTPAAQNRESDETAPGDATRTETPVTGAADPPSVAPAAPGVLGPRPPALPSPRREVGLSGGPTLDDLYADDLLFKFGTVIVNDRAQDVYPYCAVLYLRDDLPQVAHIDRLTFDSPAFVAVGSEGECPTPSPAPGVPRCAAGIDLVPAENPDFNVRGQACRLGIGVPDGDRSSDHRGHGRFAYTVTCTSPAGEVCRQPEVVAPTADDPVIVHVARATEAICYAASAASPYAGGCPRDE